MERRLAAILAADMVGYSRLMAADETGTLLRQKAHRDELIDPKITEFGGRVVKSTGDGVLVEFPSVVDALRCGVTIQMSMQEREADVSAENRILYRVGINLGDIIIEDGDIFGDGVNIAARLEALAEPGGVCVSRNVVDQVKNKVASNFQDRGEQQVKNIPDPVHAYDVLMNPEAGGGEKSQANGIRNWQRPAAAIAVTLCITLVGLFFWQPWTPYVQPASVDQMAFALPAKPSLAVLPFDNLSSDPEQEYFADGMTEDLITDLSKISGIFVIARNSTFVYKGQAVEVRKVAEDLGVRYVLEGSVRRAGNEVRINAQLIDATTGGHVWADRFDGIAVDIFAIQDDFVRKIVKALAVNLTDEEQEEFSLGQTTNLEARAAFQKGWESYLRYSPEDNAEAIGHFKQALKLDPEYGRAYAATGMAYLRGCKLRWHKPLGLTVFQANYKAKTNLSETETRPSSLASVAGSRIKLYNNRYDEAIADASRAIAQDPNDPEAHIALAWAMITTGNVDSGLELVERAMRLNPTYPNYYALARGMAYFVKDDLTKAAEEFAGALTRDPGAVELAPALAASYAHLGKRKDAQAALSMWKPGANEEQLRWITKEYHFPYEWSDDRKVLDRLYNGLGIAALPSEVTVSSLAEDLMQGTNRINAIRTLKLFGPRAAPAVPALIEALGDEKRTVRAQAATLLGDLGRDAQAAVPSLQAMEDEGFVGAVVAKSLAKIAQP